MTTRKHSDFLLRTTPALLGAALLLGGCASSKFASFDDDENGRVSKTEADGEIYYFDSYDKDDDGGLDEEEFRWAWKASEHRRGRDQAGPTDVRRRESGVNAGGGILGGGGGGFGR